MREPTISNTFAAEATALPDEFQLDLTQVRCPMAMVQAKLALRQCQSGQRLRLAISDPGTRKDVPRWLEKSGYLFHVIEQSTDRLILRIQC